MPDELSSAIAAHRAALLRHCYRMVGSYADAEDVVQDALERAWKARGGYRGDASLRRWLFTIATHACLTALARRRRRALPRLASEPAGDDYVLGELPPSHWIGPAADAKLFPDPAEQAEARETVALAFVALLQRLPPKQRAALLMKDVLGWQAEEIAAVLGLSVAAVSSAIHRGRTTIAGAEARADVPPPAALRAFVHAWESRDVDALVALLRDDVALSMPPHAIWFRGRDAVERFLRTARFGAFWASLVRVVATRANGLDALAFHVRAPDGGVRPRSLMVARFVDAEVADMTVFIGPSYFAGFDADVPGDRTVSTADGVMGSEGERA